MEATVDVATERPSERSARVAETFGDFAAIRVSHAPQNELVAAMDEARLAALAIRARRLATGRPLPMPVIRTIAEMGVGKTWAAERLRELVNPTDPDDRRRPVLICTVDTSGAPASIPSSILTALGRRSPDHGKPAVLWRRALIALAEHEVEIVIFDEVNRAARRPTMSPIIAGDLMDFIASGPVAVAFLGTSEADRLFDRAPALKDRLKSPVVMKALDWEAASERTAFISFLDAMDDAIIGHGLMDVRAGLAEEATAKLLWEVCRGRLRPLCMLLEETVAAIHRSRGKRHIDHRALADGVEAISIPNDVIAYNPFLGETAR